MKHFTFNFKWLVMSLLLCIGSSAWATDVTFDATKNKTTSSSLEISGITIATSNGTLNNGTDYRNFKSATFTISSTVGKITSVVFTSTSDTYAGYIKISGSTPGSISTSGSTTTWTYATGATSLTFTGKNGTSNEQIRATNIVVTYTPAETGETTTINISNTGITNTNKYVGTAAGSLSASVTYGSPAAAVPGATVTWSGNDDDVATINASTGVVTLVGAGTVTFTASYAGVANNYKSSSATYEMTVTNEDPSLVEIWSEDFTSSEYSTRASTYSYTLSSGTTIQSSDNYAGGSSPEIMVKGNGSFSATIPLNNGYTGDLKMSFKSNAKSITVSSGTTDVSMSGTASFSTLGTHEVTFTGITAENSEINIVFTAGSDNVRLDNIVLKGKEAPAKPTFSVGAKKFDLPFDMTISSETGTTLKYTTDGTNPATSGTATTVDSNSKTITISGTSNVTVKAIAIKDEVISAIASVTYTYDARPAPSFTLSSTDLELKVNETSSAVSLTTNSDGDITFSCADAHVTLTGTGNSRTISANAAGTYTVDVSTEETANFLAGAGTITVIVTKKETTMAIETVFADGTDLKDASAGLIEGTVIYNSVALSPQPTITYTSSSTSVATVDGSGNITFKKAGSTTITVTFEGNDEYKECQNTYELTLIDTRPQDIVVSPSFNNTFFGINAITSWKSGDPTYATGDLKNVSVTYSKGSGSYFYCNASQIRCYSGNSLSFTAPSGYYITNIEFSSSDWHTATPSKGAMNSSNNKLWEGNINNVSFSWSSTTRIESATITLAPTVTLGTNGYTTFASIHPLDLTTANLPEGVEAYKASVEGTTVTFTEIDQTVPANTGILLKGTANETVAIPVAASGTAVAENAFEVNTAGTTFTGDDLYYYFGLKKNTLTFALFDPSTVAIPANKAYLKVLKSSIPASAKSLNVVFDETTGISTLERIVIDNDAWYDLQGRRVAQPTKGIYIHNGKKIFVK